MSAPPLARHIQVLREQVEAFDDRANAGYVPGTKAIPLLRQLIAKLEDCHDALESLRTRTGEY